MSTPNIQELLDSLPDPKMVGQSEYRAVYELVQDSFHPMTGPCEDPMGLLGSILDNVIASVGAIRAQINQSVVDQLRCPTEGCEGAVHIIEDATLRRGAVSVRDDGTVVCGSGYIVWDEEAKNERLFCGDCCVEFPLPKGIEVEWDLS